AIRESYRFSSFTTHLAIRHLTAPRFMSVSSPARANTHLSPHRRAWTRARLRELHTIFHRLGEASGAPVGYPRRPDDRRSPPPSGEAAGGADGTLHRCGVCGRGGPGETP